MKKSVTLPLGLAAVGGLGALAASAQKQDPNVLIIHVDQLAAWTISAYGGGDEIKTPNIDRLAREGAMATNFYANTPVSTPSRGSLQSGLYPQVNGAYSNSIQIKQNIPTFASELRDNGYSTGYAGKWHLDGNPKRPGWDIRGKDMGWTDRKYMYSFGHYKTVLDNPDPNGYPIFKPEIAVNPEDYPTDWFFTKTINFIDKHKGEKFCFMLAIPDPHIPYSVRKPYDTMFPPETIKLPATLLQEPKSDHYLYNEAFPKPGEKAKEKSYGAVTQENIIKELPKWKSQYLGMIKLIDDQVGRLFSYMDENKLMDNTIIVFTADHGDMMGEHARMAKGVPLETAARIPFIVRYPSKIKAGTVVPAVMSNIDFYPTLLDLTGHKTKYADKLNGQDAAPLFEGKKIKWNEAAFMRLHGDKNPWVAVVTPDYKLVYSKQDVGDKPLLIDRKKDPSESYNFATDPKYASALKDLTKQLVDYCEEYNDPSISWLKPRANKVLK